MELGSCGIAVWMVSAGGVKKVFADGFESEWEAREYASMFGWEYTDENGFCWELEV